jgi:hypothetical protein
MTTEYRMKSEFDHLWTDTQRTINLVIDRVVRRVRDEVMTDLNARFNKEFLAGLRPNLRITDEAIRGHFEAVLQRSAGASSPTKTPGGKK